MYAAAATVGRDDARDDDLLAGQRILEAAFDPRLVRARPRPARVGPRPGEQLERLDDERLARAGLAGDDGQARPERRSGSPR